MNFSSSAKATISSNLRAISALPMPRMAPLRKVFSRPVSSGWKPVPTSRREPTRPWISAQPVVGRVMRERIFRRVVLPAPLRPMRPRTSPSRTSSDTSFKAQKDSSFFRRSEATGDLRNASSECRSPSSTCKPRRYSLLRPSAWMTVLFIVKRSSHPVGNGGLHAIEEEEAPEEDEGDDGAGSEKEEARGVAAACDGPAETVNDAGHGVEAVEPAPARGNERGRVGDRRGEHPELDEEGDDVFHVAIKSVERGEPQADAKSGEDSEKQKRGQPERGKSGADAVSDSENGKDDEADGEVHKAGKRGRNGKNEAREINLGDEPLVVDDDVGGHLEGVGEIGPGDESGEVEDGIGEAVGGELGEAAKKESEDEHVENGLQDDPEDADGGLLVADLDIAPDEEVKQLAVCPDFAEAKIEEAAGRLNTNGGGGARVERESDAGFRERGHTCLSKNS